MFTEKDIKPIPKYILKLIKSVDKKAYKEPCATRRFYSYLTKFKGEIVKVTVAVRHRYKSWHCKQIIVRTLEDNKCYIKDIVSYNAPCGIVVGWFDQGFPKVQKWFEDNEWGLPNQDSGFNPYAPVVNVKWIMKFKEYKYSLADKYPYHDIFNYLRVYRQYPHAELFIKFGLTNFATSKQLLSKTNKDKNFRQWLIKNLQEIKSNYYYVSTLLLAYKHNKTLKEIQEFEQRKKAFCHKDNYTDIKDLLKKGEINTFLEYIQKQSINLSSYSDYIKACKFLKLNMNLPQNRYPHDFKKWHDIRIDEYASAKALADEKERKKFYIQFAKVANKYLELQRDMKEDFVIVIAKSPADLIKEGEILHHCVGSMGYDQKFAREETLIFFVRNKDDINTPFVTLEYSLKNHKVLQCYGYKDTKPEEQVLEFVNKTWLPYANRKLKKLVA